MELFSPANIGLSLTPIIDSVQDNIGGILIVFAVIVGMSIAASLINEVTKTGLGHGSVYDPTTGKRTRY